MPTRSLMNAAFIRGLDQADFHAVSPQGIAWWFVHDTVLAQYNRC